MACDRELAAPQPVWLGDYQPFPFSLTDVDLRVELDACATLVQSKLVFSRRSGATEKHLRLDGCGLALRRILLDGRPLSADRFECGERGLTVLDVPAQFELETLVQLAPSENRSDEGLFELHGKLATQCEAEGFRKLTFFPDRPDVLARYGVTLVADKSRYPVLLSNGNPVASGELAGGLHWARWEDPFPKPSYIFALVAGDFGCISDTYDTRGGRRIALNIYADHDRIAECEFAMGALKRALAWEEEKYQRDYDLDVYNIVALTGHTGAMENKGLNIFDANGICADPDISTDQDYLVIERILAHEVFHNWTGNRVTCRDWFQLSLKEGLTRFRDQCFSQDMSDAGRKRIEQVRALQRNQFPEDDGPTAHAVRPDHYVEIRNFYTNTVYDKGAEIIRMLHGMLGDDLFRRCVMEYLARHDGQAVTVEDFVRVVESVSGKDLTRFCNWYRQAGRPLIQASGVYEPDRRRYTLQLSQHPPTATPAAAPFEIPVLLGLVGAAGEELEVSSSDATLVDGNWVAQLTAPRQDFVFDDVASEPVPSLLRGFSAPVSLQCDFDKGELALLWVNDSDPYARWQAGQSLAIQCVREQAARWHRGEALELDAVLAESWSTVLHDADTEAGLLSELLGVPDEPALSDGLPAIDLDGHRAAREFIQQSLVSRNRQALLDRYAALDSAAPWRFDAEGIGRRALRNTCLALLVERSDAEALDLALQQATQGANMTEMFAALAALCHVDCAQRRAALAAFYERWRHKAPVIDKWFNAQALSRMPGALDAIIELEQHPDLDLLNAPRAMAFYGGLFRQNRVAFHSPDGRGYDMLADRLILVDSMKPGATYWLMPQILQWRRFDEARRDKMRAALQRINSAEISDALRETVTRALDEGHA